MFNLTVEITANTAEQLLEKLSEVEHFIKQGKRKHAYDNERGCFAYEITATETTYPRPDHYYPNADPDNV